jgi:uncharacterized protein
VDQVFAYHVPPRRPAARPAHRACIAEHHAAERLLAAGPFADDLGALLLFDVPDRVELALSDLQTSTA